MVVNSKVSKIDRVILFSVRNIILLSLAGFFKAGSISKTRTLTDQVSNEFPFNIYMFLLPYVTIIPLMIMLKAVIAPKKEIPSIDCSNTK